MVWKWSFERLLWVSPSVISAFVHLWKMQLWLRKIRHQIIRYLESQLGVIVKIRNEEIVSSSPDLSMKPGGYWRDTGRDGGRVKRGISLESPHGHKKVNRLWNKIFLISASHPGKWNTSGCEMVPGKHQITCLCDHLTFFAVLMVSILQNRLEKMEALPGCGRSTTTDNPKEFSHWWCCNLTQSGGFRSWAHL